MPKNYDENLAEYKQLKEEASEVIDQLVSSKNYAIEEKAECISALAYILNTGDPADKIVKKFKSKNTKFTAHFIKELYQRKIYPMIEEKLEILNSDTAEVEEKAKARYDIMHLISLGLLEGISDIGISLAQIGINALTGELTMDGVSTGRFVTVDASNEKPFGMSNSSSYKVPQAFDPNKLTKIDPNDGQLYYDGSWVPNKYVNINGTNISLGSSKSINFPQGFDKDKLTKIDSNDGQLYYEGVGWLSGKYINVEGTTLSMGTSKKLNWGESIDYSKINRIDSDGELRYDGKRTYRYVNIDGKELSISGSSRINWPSSGGGYVSDHHRFNVAWGGDGLYFQSRNLGKRTVTFDVSAYGYGGGDLNFNVTYD